MRHNDAWNLENIESWNFQEQYEILRALRLQHLIAQQALATCPPEGFRDERLPMPLPPMQAYSLDMTRSAAMILSGWQPNNSSIQPVTGGSITLRCILLLLQATKQNREPSFSALTQVIMPVASPVTGIVTSSNYANGMGCQACVNADDDGFPFCLEGALIGKEKRQQWSWGHASSSRTQIIISPGTTCIKKWQLRSIVTRI